MAKPFRFLAPPLLLLLFASAAWGQAVLLYQKDGAASGDQLGISVAGAGDANEDGKADFLVGAYYADPGGRSGAGSAYLYSGANGSLLYQKDGVGTNNVLGGSVAGAGDVNGDGKADFIIGAYGAGVTSAGAAYVYSGTDGSQLYSKSGSPSDFLGLSAASAGDVNGDGRTDFIIGAPLADPGGLSAAGSAYIYSGMDGSLLYQKNGASSSNSLGNSVASGGDANGDGIADFIIGAVGANFGSGSAYVYSGADSSLLYQKSGAAVFNNLGISVASAGDVNGDGRSDFIIGANGADPGGLSNAGSAYVYSGADGSLLYQKNGAAAGDSLGTSVASAGDVNGDGKADFIIGAHGADPGGRSQAGSAYLYSGADGSLLSQINGAAVGDHLGNSVASAGDVSGDGKADFIIGAHLANPGGLADAGSAYVYGELPTGVPSDGQNRPNQFELSQNYPNPFNPTTTIRYFLFKRENVTLEIFNLLGERVKVLADNEQSAGEHAYTWDGMDEKGKILPSGIYFYRLTGKDFSEAKKMMFLK